MPVVNILVGVALLFFGRRAFWLFVAGVGFVAGLSLANSFLQGSETVGVIIGLGIGLLAVMLAVFVQRFAINLAGFLVGGYIALKFLPMLNLEGSWWTTVLAFVIGGVIGVILIGMFLDWALISLSSLAGASLVTEALNLSNAIAPVVFIILIIIGLVFQARKLRQDRHKSR